MIEWPKSLPSLMLSVPVYPPEFPPGWAYHWDDMTYRNKSKGLAVTKEFVEHLTTTTVHSIFDALLWCEKMAHDKFTPPLGMKPYLGKLSSQSVIPPLAGAGIKPIEKVYMMWPLTWQGKDAHQIRLAIHDDKIVYVVFTHENEQLVFEVVSTKIKGGQQYLTLDDCDVKLLIDKPNQQLLDIKVNNAFAPSVFIQMLGEVVLYKGIDVHSYLTEKLGAVPAPKADSTLSGELKVAELAQETMQSWEQIVSGLSKAGKKYAHMATGEMPDSPICLITKHNVFDVWLSCTVDTVDMPGSVFASSTTPPKKMVKNKVYKATFSMAKDELLGNLLFEHAKDFGGGQTKFLFAPYDSALILEMHLTKMHYKSDGGEMIMQFEAEGIEKEEQPSSAKKPFGSLQKMLTPKVDAASVKNLNLESEGIEFLHPDWSGQKHFAPLKQTYSFSTTHDMIKVGQHIELTFDGVTQNCMVTSVKSHGGQHDVECVPVDKSVYESDVGIGESMLDNVFKKGPAYSGAKAVTKKLTNLEKAKKVKKKSPTVPTISVDKVAAFKCHQVSPKSHALKVSFVFDDPSMYPALSVGQEIVISGPKGLLAVQVTKVVPGVLGALQIIAVSKKGWQKLMMATETVYGDPPFAGKTVIATKIKASDQIDEELTQALHDIYSLGHGEMKVEGPVTVGGVSIEDTEAVVKKLSSLPSIETMKKIFGGEELINEVEMDIKLPTGTFHLCDCGLIPEDHSVEFHAHIDDALKSHGYVPPHHSNCKCVAIAMTGTGGQYEADPACVKLQLKALHSYLTKPEPKTKAQFDAMMANLSASKMEDACLFEHVA